MGLDVEAGKQRREFEDGNESDDQFDAESSSHPSTDSGSSSPCLCQQFEHQNFLRKLEQEAVVECQWWTFFKELIYHVFFPLSLPLLYWYEGGMNGIINRQYWGKRVALRQWILAFAFYSMNIISRFFVVPDIVIANMLIIMTQVFLWFDALWVTCKVLATKYGFYTKSDMAEMRAKVLPFEALDDRTLFLAWTNPMPLRILKRQLLLAAARNNLLKCSQTLRVVPGVSRNTVQEIMHQLSHEKKGSFFMRKGVCKSRKPAKVEDINCAYCVKNSCTDRVMEDRWVQLIMTRLHHDPKCQLPESSSSDDESRPGDNENIVAHVKNKTMENEVDLPAIMLAAHLLQQSGYLLSKKKFGHQLLKNPVGVWWTSGILASFHTAIPYIVRGITGKPFVWGGNAWYVHVANLSSIFINTQCMAASVSFMIAGVADFRRRYFAARLLNTLLKDGCVGPESLCDKAIKPVDTDECLREVMKQEERRKSEYHTGVAVDYGLASSIVGWWAMRVLVLDFGLVFSRRVKYYASYFCIYCGVLLAFLLIVLFAKGTENAAYIMGVVAYDLLVFIGLLALIVFPGGETNKMHLGHGATLVFKKMEIANKLRGPLDDAPPEEREPYLFALKVMGTVSEALAWDNTITKVTILGFKAGSEVISVLLGFGGAAIGIVAQQFTSYVGSSSQ